MEKDHLTPEMRRMVDRHTYDRLLEDLETRRCSNCLEPLALDKKPEAVYLVKSPTGDPEDPEWEVTDRYCVRCVTVDQSRKRSPQEAPPIER